MQILHQIRRADSPENAGQSETQDFHAFSFQKILSKVTAQSLLSPRMMTEEVRNQVDFV